LSIIYKKLIKLILNIQNKIDKLPYEGIGSGRKLKLSNSCYEIWIDLQYEQVALLYFFYLYKII
jgi:hypothetical protein